MKKNSEIEELEKELADLKESNRAAWDMYGSELCAGEMCAEEDALQEKIEKLKTREETIKRWEKIGLLEGLDGNVNEQCAQLFESKLSFLINEDMEEKGQALLLADDLFPSLLEGGKRVTIRRGDRDIKLGKLLFAGATDGTLLHEVEVVEVRHIRVSGVSEEIAQADGFANWVDFYNGMKRYYPDLDVSEECTIIYFE